jgi:hypothetical protein
MISNLGPQFYLITASQASQRDLRRTVSDAASEALSSSRNALAPENDRTPLPRVSQFTLSCHFDDSGRTNRIDVSKQFPLLSKPNLRGPNRV